MKKCFGFVRVILIIIVVVALCNVCYRKYEEKILKDEIMELMEKDFNQDNFNTPIKTSGNYAIVEESIKQFFTHYSKEIKDLLVIVNDEKIKSMLSANNYTSDGPEFVNTVSYLTTAKENINKGMGRLINLVSKDNINLYVKKTNLSSYYQKIYNSYILGDTFSKIVDDDMNKLKQSNRNINLLIDQELKVINFLINNKNWIVRDEQVIFAREDDLITYNNLINEIS